MPRRVRCLPSLLQQSCMRALSFATRLLSINPLTPARLLVMTAASHTLVLDAFCLKQFDDPEYTGTHVAYDKAKFEAKINALHTEGAPLVDGYAPFCKHVFVPNFTPAVTPYLEITEANRPLLRSGYDARSEQELPVLIQWFDGKEAPAAPVAKYLDIILYSREQIRKEAEAMGREEAVNDAPWGIISVKAPPGTVRPSALAVPELGGCASLGRAWQAWAGRYSHRGEAEPPGAPPPPRVAIARPPRPLTPLLHRPPTSPRATAPTGAGGRPTHLLTAYHLQAQDVDHELPMQPITMMRNALGKAEGGSGVPLQRAAYTASVAFWSKFASIK